MKYFFDTEFIERGHEHPIELVSIGIVSEDNREFYAVLSDGWDESHSGDWFKQYVIPNLGAAPRISRYEASLQMERFVGGGVHSAEFWGYYSSYDFVLLCQLYGRLLELPLGWPHFCRDVKQLAVELGNPPLPEQPSGKHNALADARHTKRMHDTIRTVEAMGWNKSTT